jgi:4-amino-4-deoxy-L-arabinose transferase-like glycosyltransferase
MGIAGLERYVGVMSWLAPLMGFLGGVVGATLAGLAAWRTNSSRMAADIQAQWDAALLERSTDFVAGDSRVQVAARRVVHHAYTVRVHGEEGRDPLKDEYPDREPVGRLNDALQEFHRAVRAQLRAPDAEDVLHDDELEGIGLRPLTISERSTHA